MAKDEFYGKGSKRISGDFLEPSTPVLFEDGGASEDETRKEMRRRQREERKTARKKRRSTRKTRRLTKKINRRKEKTKKIEGKLETHTEKTLTKKKEYAPTTEGDKNTPPKSATETPDVKKDKKNSKSIDNMSFSEAYRTQRDANKKAGIKHYGDDSGHFTWRGKEYSTESKSEQDKRKGKTKKKVVKKKEETPVVKETTPKKKQTVNPKHDQDGNGVPDLVQKPKTHDADNDGIPDLIQRRETTKIKKKKGGIKYKRGGRR